MQALVVQSIGSHFQKLTSRYFSGQYLKLPRPRNISWNSLKAEPYILVWRLTVVWSWVTPKRREDSKWKRNVGTASVYQQHWLPSKGWSSKFTFKSKHLLKQSINDTHNVTAKSYLQMQLYIYIHRYWEVKLRAYIFLFDKNNFVSIGLVQDFVILNRKVATKCGRLCWQLHMRSLQT
jgi:hypothetical protein